jgi:hypothetical protein
MVTVRGRDGNDSSNQVVDETQQSKPTRSTASNATADTSTSSEERWNQCIKLKSESIHLSQHSRASQNTSEQRPNKAKPSPPSVSGKSRKTISSKLESSPLTTTKNEPQPTPNSRKKKLSASVRRNQESQAPSSSFAPVSPSPRPSKKASARPFVSAPGRTRNPSNTTADRFYGSISHLPAPPLMEERSTPPTARASVKQKTVRTLPLTRKEAFTSDLPVFRGEGLSPKPRTPKGKLKKSSDTTMESLHKSMPLFPGEGLSRTPTTASKKKKVSAQAMSPKRQREENVRHSMPALSDALPLHGNEFSPQTPNGKNKKMSPSMTRKQEDDILRFSPSPGSSTRVKSKASSMIMEPMTRSVTSSMPGSATCTPNRLRNDRLHNSMSVLPPPPPPPLFQEGSPSESRRKKNLSRSMLEFSAVPTTPTTNRKNNRVNARSLSPMRQEESIRMSSSLHAPRAKNSSSSTSSRSNHTRSPPLRKQEQSIRLSSLHPPRENNNRSLSPNLSQGSFASASVHSASGMPSRKRLHQSLGDLQSRNISPGPVGASPYSPAGRKKKLTSRSLHSANHAQSNLSGASPNSPIGRKKKLTSRSLHSTSSHTQRSVHDKFSHSLPGLSDRSGHGSNKKEIAEPAPKENRVSFSQARASQPAAGEDRQRSARPGLERQTSLSKRLAKGLKAGERKRKIQDKINRELASYREQRNAKAPLVVIWLLVAGELGLDLVTTIISFLAYEQSDYCCGTLIDLGNWALGITIPFFCLILVEMFLLAWNIQTSLWPDFCKSKKLTEMNDLEVQVREHPTEDLRPKRALAALNCVVILNPFFGFLVSWLLLYQSSKQDSLIVLGLEGGALILHFLSVYLENHRKTVCSMAIHLLPIVPFVVLIALILFYLELGGVCYVDGRFWYQGCEICGNGLPPPPGSESCPPEYGNNSTTGTFCGASLEESYCWFSY